MRRIININSEWEFTKEGATELVNLPHTWNGIDGQDGGNDYYRGKCKYTKKLDLSDEPCEKLFVKFYGVNSSAEVCFNGSKIGEHDGGYSAFEFELPSKKGTLEVFVDNSPNDRVYPQVADFTFYGGIYRDVEIICTGKVHFTDEFHITPRVDGAYADIDFEAYTSDDAVIEYEIVNDGRVIYHSTESHTTIEKPEFHLWNGVKDPHLYTANAYAVVDGEVVDKVSARFGLRSFEITPDRGFILNGEPYALRGVSRHQDRPVIGNALLPEHHEEDIELICEMGANTVRLAHYQHSQYFYDLCDERGLVVWAEIPYISNHMPTGRENTRSQMTELIEQCYNHPSIVVWGLSNEISMAGSDPDMIENHKILNNLAHNFDKTRPTTIAVVSMCPIDDEYVHISDVVSYNHYFGWYGGDVSMNGPWFDDFHSKYPNKPVGLSEYGCEALNWHATDIAQGDYTEEYQAYYHEEMIKQIAERPYLWATHVWNMFDFAADARAEGGENGMNHKGLVTFDRKYKKDSFYAYQAWLSDKPVLHICAKRYVDRVEDITKITVYSNQEEVELFVNGESVGVQKKGEFPFFYFDVKNEGESVITAKAGELTDESRINKVDTFNESYRMKEEGAVINWFEIDTPVGYYSVNDTIGDILSTFNGKLAALRLAKIMLAALKSDGGKEKENSGKKEKKEKKGATIMGFTLNKSMLKLAYEMGKGFTVKRAVSMLGGRFTKEQILKMNSILNKVKKPNKK